LIFASIALALMAARRLNNAIVAWTDLMDLNLFVAGVVMWVPTMAAWTLAWNRWRLPPWRSIDVTALVLAVAGIIGAVIPSGHLTGGSRLASIVLFVVIGARIVRRAPMRILALVTLASIMAALFGGELLIRSARWASGFLSASACRGRNTFTRSSSRCWPNRANLPCKGDA
jgi:hypothetical protein